MVDGRTPLSDGVAVVVDGETITDGRDGATFAAAEGSRSSLYTACGTAKTPNIYTVVCTLGSTAGICHTVPASTRLVHKQGIRMLDLKIYKLLVTF